ncbi:hypothetical protein ACETU7_01185 [Rhodococcus sp. 3Y1]
MANGTSDGPLQEDERAELARLREEVATLREQTPAPAKRPSRKSPDHLDMGCGGPR